MQATRGTILFPEAVEQDDPERQRTAHKLSLCPKQYLPVIGGPLTGPSGLRKRRTPNGGPAFYTSTRRAGNEVQQTGKQCPVVHTGPFFNFSLPLKTEKFACWWLAPNPPDKCAARPCRNAPAGGCASCGRFPKSHSPASPLGLFLLFFRLGRGGG